VDAMPDARKAPELLDVKMHQKRREARVRNAAPAAAVEPGWAIEPQATLFGHNRGDREPIVLSDANRTRAAPPWGLGPGAWGPGGLGGF
jgi:hypothetical protein